ncbi:MAG: hypothetical protein QOF32_2566 [Gammaproteobacteria bacterium]|nr:hypothetical protein [Gammaproteobacteria bacterium]
MLRQHALHFGEKIVHQGFRIFECVGSPFVSLGTMPMIDRWRLTPLPPSWSAHPVGVIKPDQPIAFRIVQRKRISQAVCNFQVRCDFGSVCIHCRPFGAALAGVISASLLLRSTDPDHEELMSRLAERVRFELTVPVRGRRFSRPVH